MEVTLALLADCANVTAEGKLNILGVFDSILAENFPTVHNQMNLIFRLEANAAEAGSRKDLLILLMGEDGQKLVTLSATMEFTARDPNKSGEQFVADQIIGMQNVRFEKPGIYQIAILVNGDTKKTLMLRVRQRPH